MAKTSQNRGRRPKLSPEQQRQAVAMVSGGATPDQVGAIFGVTGQTIRNVVKRFVGGVPRPAEGENAA